MLISRKHKHRQAPPLTMPKTKVKIWVEKQIINFNEREK